MMSVVSLEKYAEEMLGAGMQGPLPVPEGELMGDFVVKDTLGCFGRDNSLTTQSSPCLFGISRVGSDVTGIMKIRLNFYVMCVYLMI
jgi:hypothetical protein